MDIGLWRLKYSGNANTQLYLNLFMTISKYIQLNAVNIRPHDVK